MLSKYKQIKRATFVDSNVSYGWHFRSHALISR
jgi:hypothetical protein